MEKNEKNKEKAKEEVLKLLREALDKAGIDYSIEEVSIDELKKKKKKKKCNRELLKDVMLQSLDAGIADISDDDDDYYYDCDKEMASGISEQLGALLDNINSLNDEEERAEIIKKYILGMFRLPIAILDALKIEGSMGIDSYSIFIDGKDFSLVNAPCKCKTEKGAKDYLLNTVLPMMLSDDEEEDND